MKKYKFDILILGLVLAFFAFVRLVSMEENKKLFLFESIRLPLPTTCMTKSIFHIDCPTCGMSRSMVAWVHGDFASAWQLNRMTIVVLILILFQIPYRLWIIITGKRIALFSKPRFIGILGFSFLFLLILNWIINLIQGNITP